MTDFRILIVTLRYSRQYTVNTLKIVDDRDCFINPVVFLIVEILLFKGKSLGKCGFEIDFDIDLVAISHRSHIDVRSISSRFTFMITLLVKVVSSP